MNAVFSHSWSVMVCVAGFSRDPLAVRVGMRQQRRDRHPDNVAADRLPVAQYR